MNMRLTHAAFLIALLLIVAAAAGCASQQPPASPSTPAANPPLPSTPAANPPSPSSSSGGGSHIIEITASGYTPNPLTVKAGDTVVWVNKDTQQHWPASALHPTHKVYPDSDIRKCNTIEQSTIFDACKGMAQGETFSFTFTEKGTWQYHDHLTAGRSGTIVVE